MFSEYVAKATKNDIAAALAWYDDARSLANDMADMGNVSFDQACCIIAAYSIRRDWKTNERFSREFAAGGRPKVMRSIDKIIDNIMEYDDPFTALNGDKTNSFAKNIAGDMEAVTLDVWMIRAAGLDPTKSLNKTQYKDISHILKTEAAMAGYLPAVFQALVWIVIRGGSK